MTHDPPPLELDLTEEEWKRVHVKAGWYDAMAQQIGIESPSNPVLCVLLAAESLHAYTWRANWAATTRWLRHSAAYRANRISTDIERRTT